MFLDSEKDRIRRKILSKINTDTGCWLWAGKLHHTGYAYIEIYDTSYPVHRL